MRMMYTCTQLECGRNSNALLRDISFSLHPGEIIALTGANGCGKTTLLHTLHGLLPPVKGDILLRGKPLSQYSRRRLAAAAALMTSRSPLRQNCTVSEFLEIHTYCHGGWTILPFSAKRHERIISALELCGITSLWQRNIRRLSDGEFQLVRLCAAIVQCDSCLLLDEPFSHLDPPHALQVMDILHTLRAKGCGIIVTIHDLNIALQCADRIAGFANGTLHCLCPPDEFIDRHAADAIFGVVFSAMQISGTGTHFVFPQQPARQKKWTRKAENSDAQP